MAVNSLRRFVVVALSVMVVMLVSACSGGSSPVGPGPTPPGPPAPTSGTATIERQRPEGMKCISEGSEFPAKCTFPLSVGIWWKENGVQKSVSMQMADMGGGRFVATTILPSSALVGRFEIQVADPWLCPVAQFCSTEGATGKGITVNGFRITEGEKMGSFEYYPTAVPEVRP